MNSFQKFIPHKTTLIINPNEIKKFSVYYFDGINFTKNCPNKEYEWIHFKIDYQDITIIEAYKAQRSCLTIL